MEGYIYLLKWGRAGSHEALHLSEDHLFPAYLASLDLFPSDLKNSSAGFSLMRLLLLHDRASCLAPIT